MHLHLFHILIYSIFPYWELISDDLVLKLDKITTFTRWSCNSLVEHDSQEEDEAYIGKISHPCQQPRFAGKLELKACIANSCLPASAQEGFREATESVWKVKEADSKIKH